MKILKQICWSKTTLKCGNVQYAYIRIVSEGRKHNLREFKRLASLIRQTFPNAKDEEIFCSIINKKSSPMFKWTKITYSGYIEKKNYSGWEEYTGLKKDF